MMVVFPTLPALDTSRTSFLPVPVKQWCHPLADRCQDSDFLYNRLRHFRLLPKCCRTGTVLVHITYICKKLQGSPKCNATMYSSNALCLQLEMNVGTPVPVPGWRLAAKRMLLLHVRQADMPCTYAVVLPVRGADDAPEIPFTGCCG